MSNTEKRGVTYDEALKVINNKLNLFQDDISRQILILNGCINSIPENGLMMLINTDRETAKMVRESLIEKRQELRKKLRRDEES